MCTLLRRSLLSPSAAFALLAPSVEAQTWVAQADFVVDEEAPPTVAVADDGRVAVIRSTWDPTSIEPRRAGVTILSATGELIVKHTLGHAGSDDLSFHDGIFDGPDGVIVCGELDRKPFVGRVDLGTGQLSWTHHPFVGQGEYRHIARNSDGDYLVGGRLEDSPDVGLIGCYSSTGVERWMREYANSAGDTNVVGIVGLEDGKAAAVSHGGGFTTLFGLDRDGLVQWTRRFDGVQRPQIRSMTSTPDGDLLLVGGLFPADDEVLMRVDDTGEVELAVALAIDHELPEQFRADSSVGFSNGDVLVGVRLPNPMPSPNTSPGGLCLDAQGQLRWARNWGSSKTERAHFLERTAGDGFVSVSHRAFEFARVMRGNSAGEVGPCAGFLVNASSSPLTVTSTEPPLTSTLHPQSFSLVTVEPQIDTTNFVLLCESSCEIVGGSYGVGTPGTFGIAPVLSAVSGPCVGTGVELRLTAAVGGAPAWIGLTFEPATFPLFGGTVYLNPAAIVYLPPITLEGAPGVPGAGKTTIAVNGDLSSLLGKTVHMQGFVLDTGAPELWSMTQAATFTGQ